MTAPSDFVALILTHGRPDRVTTLDSFDKYGYTGPWVLVVDDEDKTRDQYIERFGSSKVWTFSKTEIGKQFDQGDNFNDRRCIVYARNAAFDCAEQLGYRYFIQLDDDYDYMRYRFNSDFEYVTDRYIRSLDNVWAAMLEYYKSMPESVASIAMGQGGDYLGGQFSGTAQRVYAKRKAMNSFICDTQRRFWFPGRLNEDVNAYTALQRRGLVFMSILQVFLDQKNTQTNAGGMTDIYLAQGTYVKSFYSVMQCPSAVKIALMGTANPRIHHRVNYKACAPRIMRPMPVVGP